MRKQWHKGPPPSVGWWPASMSRRDGVFRWWNGERWSVDVRSSDTAEQAGCCAALPALFGREIEWTDRPDDWPERSKT